MKKLAIYFIKAYKLIISPHLGNNCRFEPTCSNYMINAVEKFGFFKGCFLGLKRLVRCNPFSKGGYDPVPTYKYKEH
jgi:uncharacterized protein